MMNTMPLGEDDWANLDQSLLPQAFLTYLEEVSTSPEAFEYKSKVDRLLSTEPHHHILEIGCGLGDDAIRRAGLLCEKGKYVAVDTSEKMIDAALSKTSEALSNLSFQVSQESRIKSENASFDRIVADRVFQHIPDPFPLLNEIHRVLKPGGKFLVCDPNWNSLELKNTKHVAYESFKQQRLESVPHTNIISKLTHDHPIESFKIEQIHTFNVVSKDYKFTVISFRILDGLKRAVEKSQITQEQAQDWLFELQHLAKNHQFVSHIKMKALLLSKKS